MLSLRTSKLKVGGLLDRTVRGVQDTEVGRVIDVMVGDDGKPAALELDVGGFMGVGNRKIAVAWALFDIVKPSSTDPIRVALTEAQVKSAPAAEESGLVTVVTGIRPPAVVPAVAPGAKAMDPKATASAPGAAPAPVPPPATGSTATGSNGAAAPMTAPASPDDAGPSATPPTAVTAPAQPEPARAQPAEAAPAPVVTSRPGTAASVPERRRTSPPLPPRTERGAPLQADGQP